MYVFCVWSMRGMLDMPNWKPMGFAGYMRLATGGWFQQCQNSEFASPWSNISRSPWVLKLDTELPWTTHISSQPDLSELTHDSRMDWNSNELGLWFQTMFDTMSLVNSILQTHMSKKTKSEMDNDSWSYLPRTLLNTRCSFFCLRVLPRSTLKWIWMSSGLTTLNVAWNSLSLPKSLNSAAWED